MDAQTINKNYDLLTLCMGDTKLKHVGKFYIGACPFCGGRDRFNLKQTHEGDKWFCRKCGDGKYHGAIDYIMRRENLDFKQALVSLGGDVQIRPREMVTPQPPAITLPDQSWQSEHWHEVTEASENLLEFELQAQLARIYLQERALDLSTWLVYRLGFEIIFDPLTKQKRPAISIPWFDKTETITAIKYRFVDDVARDPKHRFTSASGGTQILFGLQVATGNDVLVFVEGEINAMSIAQISANEITNIDALSFGSESGSREDALRISALDYRHVIVWADDPDKAGAIRSSLARPADVLCSPVIDGTKYDANALLQKAWLAEFMREAIKHPQSV